MPVGSSPIPSKRDRTRAGFRTPNTVKLMQKYTPIIPETSQVGIAMLACVTYFKVRFKDETIGIHYLAQPWKQPPGQGLQAVNSADRTK